MKRIAVYFFALLSLLSFESDALAQCGADGTQPCGATARQTPKKAPSKINPPAPPKSKSIPEPKPKAKSATKMKAEAFYKKAWDACPVGAEECKRSYWTKAIEIDPGYVDALEMRAFSYKSAGQFDESVKDYTRLIELQPKTSKYYYFRADIAEERAKKSVVPNEKTAFYDEAIKDFSKAIELEPSDSDSQRHRGNIYLLREDFERAIDDFSNSIKWAVKKNSHSYNHYYDRGRAFAKRADKRKAQDGDAAETKRDYEAAVKDFSSAIAIIPDLGHHYAMRGYVLYQLNEFDAAVKDLTVAIKANQWDMDKFSYYWRGMAYEKLGKKDLAEVDQKKYQTLKSMYP